MLLLGLKTSTIKSIFTMSLDESSEIKNSGSSTRRLGDLEVSVGRCKERLAAVKDRVDKIEDDLKAIKETGNMSEVADTRLTSEVAQLKEDINSIFTKLDGKPSHRDLKVQQDHLEKLLDTVERSVSNHKAAVDADINDLKKYVGDTFKAKDAKWYKDVHVWVNVIAVVAALATLAVLILRGA